MIRVLLPMEWVDETNQEEFVRKGKACIAEMERNHPGYHAAEIEEDYMSGKLWLILKPTEDYEMDEGL